ncbi:universal stress protein [Curtobacterium sp. Csp2]|uniref:universal stress protein n=1 Tax=Curtobacterium sp. Csp2 TaxID=2495430 RepID=UPI0015807E02|nr:universal stress protein [Curtobacterium sp. Csp2]QKS16900.1 universal stress protein [Curtobacterium sp. Csp2]
MTAYTVAIDDTTAAWRTVDWIIDAVDPRSDSVRLLTVSEFYGEALARSEERLAAAEQRIRSACTGLAVTSDVTGGPTADRLVSDAARGDVLVIGGNQVHTFSAAVRGRVAERVVAHAVTPVVVVPEHWERADGPVVVGVDGVSAAAALSWAADRAARDHRELCLVRAWSVPSSVEPYAAVYLQADRDLWSEEADLELRAALRAVGAAQPGLHVTGEAVEGNARDVVLRSSRGASLVVVGRRHRTALGGFITGSVGERLMHNGHAPVCIVPEPARTGTGTESERRSERLHEVR